MSRVHDLIRRYDACRAVIEHGVSIFAVGDLAGAQLNAAIRRALFVLGEDRSEVWNGLLQAANVLRWRRITQPQPNAYQPGLQQVRDEVVHQATRLHHFVSEEALLDQIAAAASAVGEVDSPVGTLLWESIREVGAESCVVIASKGPARAGLAAWLDDFGVATVVPSELDGLPARVEQGYVVAPPTFVPASLVTAPATQEVAFLVPAWFGNRAVPGSSLGVHAEGRIIINARVHEIGDVSEPAGESLDETAIEDSYFPQPIWGSRTSCEREPASDEVEATKILLGGGLSLWLDDGDRIRSLNPRQPQGDRVGYEPVTNVMPGTYLVLSEGATERGAMYEEAVQSLGPRAAGVVETQERWKLALERRLAVIGAKRAIVELTTRGVRSSGQVRAWTDSRLICPQRDADFVALLAWLDLPLQPTHSNAITLRRALYKASAELRKELEKAVGQTDLRALERDGVLHLDLARKGFRGMIVARVLARAPFTEIVPRYQVRVPFPDGSAQWLE